MHCMLSAVKPSNRYNADPSALDPQSPPSAALSALLPVLCPKHNPIACLAHPRRSPGPMRNRVCPLW